MEIITLIIIAIGLSFDSFAVSISCGLLIKEIKFTQAIRFVLPLAIFQGLMPVIGWFIGSQIKEYIIEVDHWLAFVLLAIIGIRMIVECRKQKIKKPINPLNFWINISMAIATSIDALIVGISFAILNMNIYLAILIIGSITFIISMLGVLFGKKTGEKFGKNMELLGGCILILIGIKILIEHLFFQ